MPIKIRHLRNKRRGTELTYATIRLGDVKRVSDMEIFSRLKKFYGGDISRNGYAKQIKDFANDISVKEALMPITEVGGGWSENSSEEVKKYRLYKEYYILMRKVGKRILFLPNPILHDILGYGERRMEKREKLGISPFIDVLGILENGFKGKTHIDDGYDEDNAVAKRSRNHISALYSPDTPPDFNVAKSGITKGDRYTLEFFPKAKRARTYTGHNDIGYQVKNSSSKNISSVNVRLDSNSSEQEIKEKMDYYKDKITKKYGVPVRFYEISGKNKYHFPRGRKKRKVIFAIDTTPTKRLFSQKKSLEHKLTSIISIGTLAGAIGFLSSNITGNTIANLSVNASSSIGIVLFAVGIITGLYYVKSKL